MHSSSNLTKTPRAAPFDRNGNQDFKWLSDLRT
jgi:hypothetical protein